MSQNHCKQILIIICLISLVIIASLITVIYKMKTADDVQTTQQSTSTFVQPGETSQQTQQNQPVQTTQTTSVKTSATSSHSFMTPPSNN